ncbi:PFU-domain-containing protein [Polychaeton citri CBS 116435]|uniref:PFU-domain-containing protein n=1 Tax=Polychaeton citri CBS 116435 TaxID=1314669 RepID=A0A9P4Q0S8_9PEZI|nr:PFU-domain-containing protein [Polychaeton citri CBS 116435]
MAHQGDFKLSAILSGHEEDVRAIVFPAQDALFSASRDNTVRTWKLTSSKPPSYENTFLLRSEHWLNGIAYAPPSKAHPDGLIATGGRETFVFVKKPTQRLEEDAYRLLIGHANNISCLAFSDDGRKVISGGWDAQVFVWDVEEGNVVAELKGHTANIWGILVYDSKFVITACADKAIRIFDINGKALNTINGHTDVVRSFCKLPPDHWSGAAFASAGNDQIIRLWSLDGTAMGELHGHDSFIYALSILPNGDIVSSSEDRTVKIWREGQCIQTITHPAISIWTVAVCPDTGDIASGASDKQIRIFTRDPERYADSEVLKSFEDSNRMYAIPAQATNQSDGNPLNAEDLPGPDALQTRVGERDGQQLFVRERDGSVTAHLWSSSSGQWNLIGTVVSGEGTGSTKKTYNGQEYDFVFDIDIEDGKPPLKLPYNLTESSWDASRRFLESNELPFSYYEQVANWISDNTRGSRIGQSSSAQPSSQPSSQGQNTYGAGSAYQSGGAGSASAFGQQKLPQRSYVDIIEGNPANAINLICEKANQVQPNLDATDAEALRALSGQLQNKQDPKPTSAQVDALLKVLQWPVKSRVPAVGVIALCAVSPDFVRATSSGSDSIIDIFSLSGVLDQRQETANNVVHGLRTLVNLFKSDAGRLIMDGGFDTVLKTAKPFALEPESPAQLKALAALYLNYAVLLTTQTSSSESGSREARAEKLMVDIATALECESPNAGDEYSTYRLLAALGTLLTLGDAFRSKMKGGLSGTLHFASAKPGAQVVNTKELIQEIRDGLR